MEEKLYTIPLSKAKTSPKVRRSRSAIRVIQDYLTQNLKIDRESLHMDPSINEAIWSRGNKTIPSKLRVRIVQSEEGIIEASLPGIKTRSEIEKELEKKAKKEKEKEKEKKEKKGKGTAEEKSSKDTKKDEEQGDKTGEEAPRSRKQDEKKQATKKVPGKKTSDAGKKNTPKDESPQEKEGS